MKKRIRVLVVDDSDFTREFIIGILSEDDEIEVVGEAANGVEAVAKTAGLRPDIVTMDVVMPVMDGLEAIEKIMSSNATPILVVTSKSDVNTAYQAVSRGALEVIGKPDLDDKIAAEFIRKIKFLSKVRVIAHIKKSNPCISATHLPDLLPDKKEPAVPQTRPATSEPQRKPGISAKTIVAIASSTGGPKALSVLLASFPADFPASIVIAQHIPDDFVSGLVDWLDGSVRLKVKSGEVGEFLKSGTVYVSPSERHMKIDRAGSIAFEKRGPSDIYFPSCNALLSSVADVFGRKSIGVILTGMGDDGVSGIGKIKQAGGFTIAQDENSSVVYGMPKVAVESGFLDKVLPIEKIADQVISLVNPGPGNAGRGW